MSTITYAMGPVDNFCGRYILNDAGEPVPEPDILKWGEWIGTPGNKRIASTHLSDGRWVSTVFLGLDHNFGFGPPLLFETMVFSRNRDGDWLGDDLCKRYATRHDALVGHATLVEMLRPNPPPS